MTFFCLAYQNAGNMGLLIRPVPGGVQDEHYDHLITCGMGNMGFFTRLAPGGA